MNILITAIGSMSAECVLSKLKEQNHYIVGCDIYPKEWHYETTLCDVFIQAPYATAEELYIQFILEICNKYRLNYIIPLTDLEIDVLNQKRSIFESLDITLCMQSGIVLEIVRNKFNLYKYFENDKNVPSIKTFLLNEMPENMTYPCIIKPFNGRSSEGVKRIYNKNQLSTIEEPEKNIIQEYKTGNIFTVDYCRNAETGTDVAIPRIELLRTKNGAGLTVQTIKDNIIIKLASYIGKKIDINGCVNMEFIFNNNHYFLIDINPRFSAGIAFSAISGYDMVSNHLRCFTSEEIDKQPKLQQKIIIKKYQEFVV